MQRQHLHIVRIIVMSAMTFVVFIMIEYVLSAHRQRCALSTAAEVADDAASADELTVYGILCVAEMTDSCRARNSTDQLRHQRRARNCSDPNSDTRELQAELLWIFR